MESALLGWAREFALHALRIRRKRLRPHCGDFSVLRNLQFRNSQKRRLVLPDRFAEKMLLSPHVTRSNESSLKRRFRLSVTNGSLQEIW